MTVAVETGAGLRHDAHVVGTVSAAHFFSHFFQYALPVLFPLIHQEYGVGYATLGLLPTVFYGVSGVAQTGAGFVVDRVGAPRVLACGLLLLVLGMSIVAVAPSFWLFYPAVALAGLGNSVFHPADYSIISHRVTQRRLGRAYAVHAVAGTIGYAAAPLAMIGLASLLSWRAAILLAAAAGAAVALVVLARLALLSAPREPATRAAAGGPGPLAALRQPAVLLCFSFFFLMAAPSVGMSGFLATVLGRLFATPLETAAAAFSAYLAGNAAGVLAGGVLADRTQHQERTLMASVTFSSMIFLLVGSLDLPPLALGAILACGGFSAGLATPSRDMLVKRAAASSAMGKVFGFAYSGFDLGSALVPPLLGLLVDHGRSGLVLPAIACALLLVNLSAVNVARRRPAAAVTESLR